MKRLVRLSLWVVVLVAGLTLPALAQETRFEVVGGIHYPLLSQKYYADQGLGFHGKLGFRVSPKVSLFAVYETQTTNSSIPNWPRGDVKVKTYGLNATMILAGDPALQLFGILGAGTGKIDYTNPRAPEQYNGLPDSTDIKLWYELGAGVQFGLAKHWALRIQFTGRQTEPKDASAVIGGTRFSIVPAVDFAYRF